MAVDKKPSSYSNRGGIRSTEELETYGVWVKSEPQDMASEMAGARGFGDGAVPFDAGFDMGYGDMGIPVAGGESPDMAFDSFGSGDFADDFGDAGFAPDVPFERAEFTESGFDDDGDSGVAGGGSSMSDESSKLLLKIAGELSSIKSELDFLKKEVADIRAESEPGERDGVSDGGFFFGEDDGKISLTDNEMNGILASGFAEGHPDLVFAEGDVFGGSMRDEDAAALRRLSQENEAAGKAEDDDGEIDFGMGLGYDDADSDESGVFDTDLEFLTGESRSGESAIGEDDVFQAFADELPSPDVLDDADELRDLRIHGADPLTPLPEDISHLDDDPFAQSEAEAGDLPGDDDVFGFGDQYSFGDDMPSLDGEFFADDLPAIDDELPAGEDALADGEDLPPLSAEGLADADGEPSADGEGGDAPLPPWLLSEEGFAAADSAPQEEDSPADGEISLEDSLALDGGLVLDEDPFFEDDSSFEGMLSIDDDDGTSPLDEELVMDDLPPIDDSFLNDEAPEEPALAVSPESPLDDDPMLDDISLEMESFEIDDPAIEDSILVREIPEAFQVDAEEALVSDDDLEAIAEEEESPLPAAKPESQAAKPADGPGDEVSQDLRQDLKGVLSYMDQLLESLPEDKIEEFAKSEHFDTYRKVFKELGLVH